MSTIQASRLQICIFCLKDAEYDDQPADVQAMFDAFAAPVIAIQQQHGNRAPIELTLCPMSYDSNVAIVTRQGLDLSRLPAAQVYAEYPNGTQRVYFLKKGIDGISFTPEVLRPYITTLLYNREASPKPIICKILPPACEVGVWLWLAATLYAGYRTTQARNVGKALWGGATLMAGEAFLKGGGLEKIKNSI